MVASTWQAIEGNPSDGVVVVVDFIGAQQQNTLLSLVGALEPAPAFVQPPFPAPGTVAAGAHVEEWCTLLRDDGWAVRMVLGQCGGAALACALADRLAQHSPYPPVLLLDPYLIPPAAMVHELNAALGQYADFVPRSVIERVIAGAPESSDVAATARYIDSAYRELSASVLTDLGVDEDVVDELCDRFTQYVDFLHACAATGFGSSRASVVTLMSDDFDPPPLLHGRVTRYGGSHEQLLGDPRAITAINDVLSARA